MIIFRDQILDWNVCYIGFSNQYWFKVADWLNYVLKVRYMKIIYEFDFKVCKHSKLFDKDASKQEKIVNS